MDCLEASGYCGCREMAVEIFSRTGGSGWVLYVTNAECRVQGFAEAVVRAGLGLKPVSVAPARVGCAIRDIQPRAVVLDSRLQGGVFMVLEEIERHSPAAVVLSDDDLSVLPQLLRSLPVTV